MRRFVLLATMGALAMTGCATTARTGRGDARIDIIAHRGASAKAPENTLAAFRLAHDLRADWFELDCTLTSDGEVVCIHDGTVDRTTNATGEYVIYDIPLLVESIHKYKDFLNVICVVDCEESEQIQRVQKRSGLSVEAIMNILKAQASREDRLRHADDVLVNDKDLKALQTEVERLHHFYLTLRGGQP